MMRAMNAEFIQHGALTLQQYSARNVSVQIFKFLLQDELWALVQSATSFAMHRATKQTSKLGDYEQCAATLHSRDLYFADQMMRRARRHRARGLSSSNSLIAHNMRRQLVMRDPPRAVKITRSARKARSTNHGISANVAKELLRDTSYHNDRTNQWEHLSLGSDALWTLQCWSRAIIESFVPYIIDIVKVNCEHRGIADVNLNGTHVEDAFDCWKEKWYAVE